MGDGATHIWEGTYFGAKVDTENGTCLRPLCSNIMQFCGLCEECCKRPCHPKKKEKK